MGSDDILKMSVELAKAHLSANPMESGKVPEFIQEIHRTLLRLHGIAKGAEPAPADVVSERSEADAKVAPIINEDISDLAFHGLEPWLAQRVSQRTAKKLNRDDATHPSIFNDYLICLEDGQEVKLLRPYLERRFGLSVPEYMDKWNLPDDYPTAPPAYLRAKREAARKTGLGATLRGKRGKAKARNRDTAA